MSKIIHFEFTTPTVTNSAEFFRNVFGWKSTASPFLPGYLMLNTGNGQGIDGAIMSRDYQQQPIIAWIETDNIVTSLAEVTAHGGTVVSDAHELPGEGIVAYFTDPTGTLWGAKQPA